METLKFIGRIIHWKHRWILIPDPGFLHNELKIPRNFSSPENIIAIYVWNESASSQVDVDDVSLDFIEKQLPVFLPENYPPINGDKKFIVEQDLSGNYFNADYDSGSGSIKNFDQWREKYFWMNSSII